MLYLKLFVHLSMTWIILLWIFQGYSLFSYQCSLLFSATLICYHAQERLSTTFLFCFLRSFKFVRSFDIVSQSFLLVKNFFIFSKFFVVTRLRQLVYSIKLYCICQQLFSSFFLNCGMPLQVPNLILPIRWPHLYLLRWNIY